MSRKPITKDQKPETAVVLLNMGAAASADVRDVEAFLFELFYDPNIIHFPLSRYLQRPLARMIAKRRAPSVAPHYDEIGGSPLVFQTEQQAKALEEKLGVPVLVAMRYSEPRADGVIEELAARGVRKIVALPMYPQYSRATTESSFDELRTAAQSHSIRTVEIRSYPAIPKFIDALMARWNEKIWQDLDRSGSHILLAAHGIPVSYVEKGDTYIDEVNETAKALRAKLPRGVPVSLAFQSRVGPVKWVQPFLDEEVKRLGAKGCRTLIVFPITFVSEHLETLWELDLFIAKLARESGIKEYIRIPAVKDHPLFIEALAELAEGVIDR